MAKRTTLRKLVLPYESLRTLYMGDSEVRLCRNEITKAHQVVKAIDTLGLEGALAVQEATLLQKIRHKYVVPVSDVAENPSYKGLKVIEMIMPFYSRGSVCDAFLRGETFGLHESIQLISTALHGLAEIHDSHRVLHRDVKSPNLFLADDGSHLLIGDLGLAAPMDDDGTAEAYPTAHVYTVPETYRSGRVGKSADIYGIGLTLMEMVNREPLPYSEYYRDDILKNLEKGRRAVRTRHLQFAPFVPRRLRTIVRKATSVDPARRFPRAQDMQAALAAVRLVDWAQVIDESKLQRWEGASVQDASRLYAVEAQRRRDGAWRVVGLGHLNAWRRVREDQLVPDLSDSSLAPFFESMVRIATSR